MQTLLHPRSRATDFLKSEVVSLLDLHSDPRLPPNNPWFLRWFWQIPRSLCLFKAGGSRWYSACHRLCESYRGVMRRQFRSTSDLPAEVLTAATEGDVLTANQILPSRNKREMSRTSAIRAKLQDQTTAMWQQVVSPAFNVRRKTNFHPPEKQQELTRCSAVGSVVTNKGGREASLRSGDTAESLCEMVVKIL